jgi:hypothetical protein
MGASVSSTENELLRALAIAVLSNDVVSLPVANGSESKMCSTVSSFGGWICLLSISITGFPSTWPRMVCASKEDALSRRLVVAVVPEAVVPEDFR